MAVAFAPDGRTIATGGDDRSIRIWEFFSAKEIRQIDPSARVAMVTAMGQQAMVMAALKAGAKDFVLKPFQPDRILATLHKLLAA